MSNNLNQSLPIRRSIIDSADFLQIFAMVKVLFMSLCCYFHLFYDQLFRHCYMGVSFKLFFFEIPTVEVGKVPQYLLHQFIKIYKDKIMLKSISMCQILFL